MPKKRLKSPTQEGSTFVKWFLIVFLLISAAISCYPFVYMVFMSFMETYSPQLSWGDIVANKWTLDNYMQAFRQADFLLYIKNSTIVTVYSVLLNLFTASTAAYAFAKKKFTGSKTLYMLYLATMMIPSQVTLIPTFLLLKWMGLLNTYSAMALPTCGAFGVMLIYSFMKGVPDELLEAADLDGCSEFRKFFSIVLPLIKTVLISLAIFTFINVWGSLVLPLIVATEPKMTTLTLAIANMKSSHTATNYGFIMAGNTIAFLPPFILYLFLQKQFVEGIALSGTKG